MTNPLRLTTSTLAAAIAMSCLLTAACSEKKPDAAPRKPSTAQSSSGDAKTPSTNAQTPSTDSQTPSTDTKTPAPDAQTKTPDTPAPSEENQVKTPAPVTPPVTTDKPAEEKPAPAEKPVEKPADNKPANSNELVDVSNFDELAKKGYELYKTKGCIACHQISPNQKNLPPAPANAPSHIGLFGRTTELQDGTKLTIDEAYIIESIKVPTAKLAKGYLPIMPPLPMTDDEIKAIIAFLKVLK